MRASVCVRDKERGGTEGAAGGHGGRRGVSDQCKECFEGSRGIFFLLPSLV